MRAMVERMGEHRRAVELSTGQVGGRDQPRNLN